MASPSLISSGKGGASGSTSPTLNAGTITAGNTVLAFASDTDGNTLSVSGSSGGAYTLVGQIGGTNPRLRCFKKENHPGGAETLTFSFGSAADPALSFEQWSPCTVDSSSLVTDNTGSTPWPTTSNALASANSTVIFAAACDGGGTVVYSESTGFTKDQEQGDGNLYWTHATFYKAVAATTAVSSSLTISAGIALGTGPKRMIFALTATGGGSGSAVTAAAGVATTSTLAGRSNVTSTPTAAAGTATASALAGRASASAGVTPAAGAATSSTFTGRSNGTGALTAAAGQASTNTLQANATSSTSLTPAAGQGTGATLVGSAQQPGTAAILPAVGTSTASTLQGSAQVIASIVPAGGVATTGTLTSNGAPARGMEVDYEAGPSQAKPRRAKFVSIKPPLQAALESRLPEPEPEELDAPPAVNAVSAGIQALQNEQLTPELVARLAQQWRPAAEIAQNSTSDALELQYLRAVQAEKEAREAQAARDAQLAADRARAKARSDDEEAIARAVALLF